MNQERLEGAGEEFKKLYGKDVYATAILDVTKNSDIREAMDVAALAFGGIDIIVNNAGLSISKPITEHTEKDWDLLYDVW
jgi:NADP-dependent 3-hydroxy acid dehydrogenase YdfG